MAEFSGPVGIIFDGPTYFAQPIISEIKRQYPINIFAPHFVRLPLIGKRFNDQYLQIQLRRFLGKHKVVFFEWAGALLVLVARMKTQSTLVVRMHSLDIVQTAPKVNWEQVSDLILISNSMQQQFLNVTLSRPSRMHIINNGVDLTRFQPVPHNNFQHRIGMACRVVPLKRVYEAIINVYEMRQKGFPYTLHVAGELGDSASPRYPMALRNLVKQLSLEDAVTFYGKVENMAYWYQNIDIFLSNSYWEGQQMALLEAMASGCICLSHAWSGSEEVLPPDYLFITNQDLQDKLESLASLFSNVRQSIRDHMRSLAEEHFNEDRMTCQTVEVIRQSANSRLAL